jgi:alpha-tubulin suppressor-like RCC1 family protein
MRNAACTAVIALSLFIAGTDAVPQLPQELDSSSFVITSDGELYSWGFNREAQTGTGLTNLVLSLPVLVARPEGVSAWRAVAGGMVSGAISEAGDVYFWGRIGSVPSSSLQLTPNLFPRPPNGGRWISVASGDLNSAPITLADDGNLYKWNIPLQNPPVLVPRPAGVSGWRKVTAGRSYYLALTQEGELYEWNPPVNGQFTLRKIPVPERPPRATQWITNWVDVSSSATLRVALGDDGELYQWIIQSSVPARIFKPINFGSWKDFSAGYNHIAAIGGDDRLYTWRFNGAEALTTEPPPGKWVSVATGMNYLLVIGDDCRLFALGQNNYGQLGTGNSVTYYGAPTPVNSLQNLCNATSPAPGTITLSTLPALFQHPNEFRFQAFEDVAQPLVISRSSDLKNWLPISTNAPLDGWKTLSDSNLQNAPFLFYRIAPQ